MAVIMHVEGVYPTFGKDCFLAPNATVVGDVETGDQCSVWFNAVVRGDVNSIRMGNKVNVQDGAILHATYEKTKAIIGNNVSIGHNAIVHGCTIHDDVLIGMGSIVMDNVVVHSNTIIAAGAIVLEGTVYITPYHSVKPDTAVIAGFHIAHNSCIGCYKTIISKFWINTVYMHNNCHSI